MSREDDETTVIIRNPRIISKPRLPLVLHSECGTYPLKPCDITHLQEYKDYPGIYVGRLSWEQSTERLFFESIELRDMWRARKHYHWAINMLKRAEKNYLAAKQTLKDKGNKHDYDY